MFPFRTQREARPWFLLMAAVSLLQAAALFASVWQQSGGHFMLPLDDSYIHLQYAKRLAQGHVLSFSPGAAPSGGASSPLWVMLLTPAFLAGLAGVKGAAFAFAAGLPLYFLAAAWLYQLAARLTNDACGAIAAGLFLTNGHVAWAFFSGMETGLFAVLLLGASLGLAIWFQDEWPCGRRIALGCLALLPLARPEGIVIVPMAALLAFLRRREHARLSVFTVLLCALPFAAWLALLRFETGDWRPSGLVIKGLFSDPEADAWWVVRHVGTTLAAIFSDFYSNHIPDPGYVQLKKTDSMPYVPPGMLWFALFGAGAWLVGEWRSRRPAAASWVAALWLAGIMTVACSRLPFIHQQRYLVPWTIPAIILTAAGIKRIAALFQQHEELAAKALGFGLIAVSLPSVPFWIAESGRNGRDLYQQHRVLSFALETVPRDAVLAVSDTGILIYYSGLPHVDVIGLTSREFTEAIRWGEGAMYEAMQSLPAERRPAYFATFDDWWSAGFRIGETTASTWLADNSITGGSTLSLHQWQAREAHIPSAGARIAFDLDLLNPESERAADYRFELSHEDLRPNVAPPPNRPVRTHRLPSGELGTEGTRWVRREDYEVKFEGADSATTRTLCLLISPGAPDIEPERTLARGLWIELTPRADKTSMGLIEWKFPGGNGGDWILIRVPTLYRDFHVRVRADEPEGAGWYSAGAWVEVE